MARAKKSSHGKAEKLSSKLKVEDPMEIPKDDAEPDQESINDGNNDDMDDDRRKEDDDDCIDDDGDDDNDDYKAGDDDMKEGNEEDDDDEYDIEDEDFDSVDEGSEEAENEIVEAQKKMNSKHRNTERSAFLDAFDGLASNNSEERSRAGQVILYQSILSPQKANVTDAAYTLKRLLNGLCSGRAATRQGSAATLTSFLKVSMAAEGYLTEILHAGQQENISESSNQLGKLAHLRSKLKEATTIEEQNGGRGGGGRKKASEIKDRPMGRLFGILAMVRSGILLPNSDDDDNDDKSVKNDKMGTTKALLSDLHELYHYKPFMREPTSHAVCTLLKSFIDSATNTTTTTTITDNPKEAMKMACRLVVQCVVPLFLKRGDLDTTTETSSSLLNSFSAEQIAMAVYVQSFGNALASKSVKKMGIVKDPILTKDNLPMLAKTLADTCLVKPSRMHLVWDAILLYLTEPLKEERHQIVSQSSKHNKDTSLPVHKRVLRRKLPLSPDRGGNSPRDLIKTVLDEVLIKILLASGQDDDDDNDSFVENDGDGKKVKGKEDHTYSSKSNRTGRTYLAFNLIQIMAGVEFVSSLSGRTMLTLDSEEHLFQDIVVRKLFIDVLRGSGGVLSGKDTIEGGQLLKTLALDCLNNIVDSVQTTSTTTTAESAKMKARRLVMLKSFVRSDARFDYQTKTSIVQDLLELNALEEKGIAVEVWTGFITFVQDRILMARDLDTEKLDGTESSYVSVGDAVDLLDLLFQLAKQIMRMEIPFRFSPQDAASLRAFKESATRQIASFVFPAKVDTDATTESTAAFLEIAQRVSQTNLPLDTRKSLQARPFSRVDEYVIASSSSAVRSPSASKSSTVVASVKPEQSLEDNENRIKEYGVVTPGDEIRDNLVEGRCTYPEGVRMYLHKSESDCASGGSWAETGDRHHVCRIVSRPDDACVGQQITLSTEEEEWLTHDNKDCSVRADVASSVSNNGFSKAAIASTSMDKSMAGVVYDKAPYQASLLRITKNTCEDVECEDLFADLGHLTPRELTINRVNHPKLDGDEHDAELGPSDFSKYPSKTEAAVVGTVASVLDSDGSGVRSFQRSVCQRRIPLIQCRSRFRPYQTTTTGNGDVVTKLGRKQWPKQWDTLCFRNGDWFNKGGSDNKEIGCVNVPLWCADGSGGSLRVWPSLLGSGWLELLQAEMRGTVQYRQYRVQNVDEPRVHALYHVDANENLTTPGYKYAKVCMKSRPLSELPEIRDLAQKLLNLCGLSKWEIGVNPLCYRDGNDALGMHSDDDQGAKRIMTVVVDSPPQSRNVLIQSKKSEKCQQSTQPIPSEQANCPKGVWEMQYQLILQPGDAYEMDDVMQTKYDHSVPRDMTKAKGDQQRLVIVFRSGDTVMVDEDKGRPVLDLEPRPDLGSPYIFGPVAGILFGQEYSWNELCQLRGHSSAQRGISGNKGFGCDSIILSGKRKDHLGDDYYGFLLYVAEYRIGAASLLYSAQQQELIRVFRRSHKKAKTNIYRYDGLYEIVAAAEEGMAEFIFPGKSGNTKVLFVLRMAGWDNIRNTNAGSDVGSMKDWSQCWKNRLHENFQKLVRQQQTSPFYQLQLDGLREYNKNCVGAHVPIKWFNGSPICSRKRKRASFKNK